MKEVNARIEKVDSGKHFAIFWSSLAYVECVLSEFNLLDATCEKAPLR